MSNSEAFDDIGPSAPSPVQIAGRIRKAKEHLAMAETRLNQGEYGAALRRLDYAAQAASPTVEN